MSLNWDRTAFDKGFTKVFHVVPYGATYYTDLCKKYGPDNVFRAVSATAENVPFTDAIAACMDGRNDVIRVYPGTYTFAAVVTVNKACTIEPATNAPNGAVIDLLTSQVGGFIVTAAGATVRGLRFTMYTTGVSCAVNVTTSNVLVEDNTFVGTTTSTTNAYTIQSNGDCTTIRRNNLNQVSAGIKVDGACSDVNGNTIMLDSLYRGSSGTAIEVTGSAAGKGQGTRVFNNVIQSGGTTTNYGIRIVNASAYAVAVFDNRISAKAGAIGFSAPIVTAAGTVVYNNLSGYVTTYYSVIAP